MAKGKRNGHRPEDIIASHAMKHHDFIGQAEPERKEAEQVKHAHVEKDAAKLEGEVVREMAREFEQQAGLRPPHKAANEERTGLIGRGMSLFEEARDDLPHLLESLRHKAEERLAGLPTPLRRVVHRGEQAATLLVAPARIGFALARELLKAPLHLVENLRKRAV